MKPYLTILYLIACVALGAAADSTAHLSYYDLSVVFDLIEKFMLLSGPFIFRLTFKQWWAYVFVLLLFYMVGFDYAYNWIHGLRWDYHGTVKTWDKILSKYPEHGILYTRAILLTAAISITFRYLK